MMPVSQDTRDFLHEFYRRVYGETIEEALQSKDAALQSKDAALQSKDAALQSKDAALQSKDAALQSKDAALQSKDAIIIRSIINLRDSMNLSATQTASILGIEVEYVEKILAEFKD
jgi:uncharacterized protein (DUF3084 family)